LPPWRTCCRHGFAWFCCILTLLPFGNFSLLLPLANACVGTNAPASPSEKAPIDDDEDDEESSDYAKTDSEDVHGRQLRHRRSGQLSAVLTASLAHLPHRHDSQAGFSLPLHSPYDAGGRMPLRC